jgi:hypothetical protein
MSAVEFFKEMTRLHETGQWDALEDLLKEDHPLIPGEREAFLELKEHVKNPGVRTDDSELHVVRI